MTEPLTVPEIEELLGAYALDAVEPDEREIVEAHLATCPRCQAELAQHLETASQLALGGTAAPTGLWDRIAGALEDPPPALALTVRPKRRASPLLVGLAVAAAVVLIAVGVVAVVHQTQSSGRSSNFAQGELTNAAMRALDDPTSDKLTLKPPAGANAAGTQAVAVLAADGTGYLMPHNLPALRGGRVYQLWGIQGPNKLVSLGLLGSDPQLSAFAAGGHLEGLAITDEVAGGVAQSSQTPVLVGKTT